MQLQLLGTPHIWYGDRAIDFPTSRATLLALYLAVEGGWVTRKKLAHFFRPDAEEASARHYVRKMLCAIREYPWAVGIEVEKDRLRWSTNTDVKQLEAAAKAGHFQQAIDHYGGPLLNHLDIHDSPNFEAWLEERREELNVLWQDSCLSRAAQLESSGNYQQAANMAHRVLLNDSLAESALQRFIRNTYLAGNRVMALQGATKFAKELEQETGLRPLPETLRLISSITHSEPIARIISTPQTGRRATDSLQKHAGGPQLKHLSGVLQDPQVRFLDIRRNAENTESTVSLRLRDTAFILEALINLAEQLASQGHYERSNELLDVVFTFPSKDVNARARQLKIWLDSHTFTPHRPNPPVPAVT